MMTIDEFRNHLKKAASNQTLLIPKHDPENLGTSYSSYRTVLSYDLVEKLNEFIDSGNYSVIEYENRRFHHSPFYFEITPNQDSGFNVTASGVTANSIFASTVVDKIIAVSGQTNGWHLFGESSYRIQSQINNGDLICKNKLS